MNIAALYDLMLQGLRVIFILGIPVLAATAAAGFVISAVQAATSINDPASRYGIRLLALILVLYLMAGTISDQLTGLAGAALR